MTRIMQIGLPAPYPLPRELWTLADSAMIEYWHARAAKAEHYYHGADASPVRSAVESTSGSITIRCGEPAPATTRTRAVSAPLIQASVWASGERMSWRRQSCVERSQATGAAPEGAVAIRLFTVTSRTSSKTSAGRG